MKTLLVFSIFSTLSLCALLADTTDIIASVHLIQNDQLHPLSEIYEDSHTLKHKETVHISLKFADRHYVLEMTKGNDIVSPDFVHRLIDENGNEEHVQHNLFEHCAYEGHVRGFEESSQAHVLTCGGKLRGALRFPNEQINIAQKEGKTVVTLRQHESEDIAQSPSEETYITFNISTLPTEKRQVPAAPNNVISVLYVVAPSAKKKWASFGWTVGDAVRTELFIVDAVYKTIGLRVQIIQILESPELAVKPPILSTFVAWNSKRTTPKRDFSFYRTGLENLPFAGTAATATMCKDAFPSGQGNIFGQSTIYNWAKTFAHEMGHSIGMGHDVDCCPKNEACIMSFMQPIPPLRFSPCAIKDMNAHISTIAKAECFKATSCTYGQWGPWTTGKCGGYKFRSMSASNGCVGPRELQPNPCPKAVLEKDEIMSTENVDTNSVPVQLWVGVIVGFSIFVVVVVAVVAVVLSRRNKSEERA